MADTKISALPAVTNLLSTDEFVLARSSVTNKITGATLANFLASTTDGWTADVTNTWTYASASTFTITGNVTAVFQKGTRLKFTQTTVKYGVVANSSHSAGTTTVTIAVNTDYVLANAAISATYYSYQASPQGYPGWFAYTPTYGGFSAAPSATVRFNIIGTMCTVYHSFTAGTSNATNFTISMPVAAISSFSSLSARVQNNGAILTPPGLIDLPASATMGVYPTGAAGTWNSGSTKAATFFYTYHF